jgi:hypothetical protein
MYEYLFNIYILLIILYFFYRSFLFINFILYFLFSWDYIVPNISIQHVNIYTSILNFISTFWTINEYYITIQLFLLSIIIYYLNNIIIKKQLNFSILLISLYIFYIMINVLNYNYIEIINYIPNTITNFNTILSHTLVSIHPPLILFSILCLRVLILFYSNIIIYLSKIKMFSFIQIYTLIYYILTISIILGSFWSINLFGWGGWWIWDPIENISFFYWLLLLVLIHTPIQSKKLLYFILYLFVYDYFFFCTFKLSLLNSLHIFKNSLVYTNIFYFFYLFFCYIFIFLLIYTMILTKKIIKISIPNLWLFYILSVLMFFYLYNLFASIFITVNYSQNLLNIIYIPLLYIINFEFNKQILNKILWTSFIIIGIFLIMDINIFFFYLLYLFLFCLIYPFALTYYTIIHFFFNILLLGLLVYTFNIYIYSISNYIISLQELSLYTIINNNYLLELYNLQIINSIFNFNFISENTQLLNIYTSLNINAQINELMFITSFINNNLINFYFNIYTLYSIINLQYTIIVTVLYLIYYIYYKYYIQINNNISIL